MRLQRTRNGFWVRFVMLYYAKRRQPRTLAKLPGGAFWRQPWPAEVTWLRQNINISGYADISGSVVVNPFFMGKPSALSAVLLNEAVRVFIWRRRRLAPMLALTPIQRRNFEKYGKKRDQIDTVLARLVTADLSAGSPNCSQRRVVAILNKALKIYAIPPEKRCMRSITIRHNSKYFRVRTIHS